MTHTARQPHDTINAIVMARVSTAEQARDDRVSLPDQLAKGRAEVTRRDWVLHDTATDVFTGTTSDRPELTKIMAAARAGDIQAIVFTKVDRLARDLRDLLNIEAELARHGVAIVATDQPIDTSTPYGRMAFQQLGSFAEFERTMILERMVNGQRSKARKGGWPGGSPPFGFRIVGVRETAKLEHDPDEVEVINTAVALLLENGKTLSECADTLNAHGYRPRKAARWDGVRVRWVLSNPALVGELAFAKDKQEKPWRSRGGHHASGKFGGPIEMAATPILDRQRSTGSNGSWLRPRSRHGGRRGRTCSASG
jgi:DNA invertase Pin-like site-specific DNA recombinase